MKTSNKLDYGTAKQKQKLDQKSRDHQAIKVIVKESDYTYQRAKIILVRY